MGKKRHFLSGFGKISSSRESLSGREGNEIKKKWGRERGGFAGKARAEWEGMHVFCIPPLKGAIKRIFSGIVWPCVPMLAGIIFFKSARRHGLRIHKKKQNIQLVEFRHGLGPRAGWLVFCLHGKKQ